MSQGCDPGEFQVGKQYRQRHGASAEVYTCYGFTPAGHTVLCTDAGRSHCVSGKRSAWWVEYTPPAILPLVLKLRQPSVKLSTVEIDRERNEAADALDRGELTLKETVAASLRSLQTAQDDIEKLIQERNELRARADQPGRDNSELAKTALAATTERDVLAVKLDNIYKAAQALAPLAGCVPSVHTYLKQLEQVWSQKSPPVRNKLNRPAGVLTLEEAKRTRCCRLCGGSLLVTYDWGHEHAHTECLKQAEVK